MTAMVSVSVIAGPIRKTTQPRNERIGQQVAMTDEFYFSITPDIARQWIQTLTPIAEEESK